VSCVSLGLPDGGGARLSVSGCSSALSGLGEQPIISTATASPRMQAGEQINVTVYGEASLSGNYAIDPDGFVSVPLREGQGRGLTPAEFSDIL